MPINSWPIDQSAFKRITFVQCEPKMAMERDSQGNMTNTGVQQTTKDGSARKWTLQAVFSQVSRFDSSRTESEVKDITITAADDPGQGLDGGEIRFVGLAVGAMAPEQTDTPGRIRGGRIFLSAEGVQPVQRSAKS